MPGGYGTRPGLLAPSGSGNPVVRVAQALGIESEHYVRAAEMQ